MSGSGRKGGDQALRKRFKAEEQQAIEVLARWIGHPAVPGVIERRRMGAEMAIMPIEPMSDSLVPMMQIDEQMMLRTREQIAALALELGLPANAGSVEAGSARSEILRYAREQSSDLIVLGSRERHGLSILLHRTEDSVLHGAPCDVLAVRVR